MKIQTADDKVKKHLKRIEEQVSPCGSIVDDLLEYTRGRHSKMIGGDLKEWMANVLETFSKARGTGLGLAVVRKIIEEHHGTVSIESRIDSGIKVSIELLQTLNS